jgi:tRNA (guanine37-N1)-methyltransferase
MRFDIVTIFPAMITHALGTGVVGRAIERGTIEAGVHDLRDFTGDRHRVVDDMPYGGGPGMVLKAEPLFRALDHMAGVDQRVARVLLTSPQGTRLTQPVVERLSREPRLVIVCGRYEGVDERVRARVHEEISIGDYVLSGGELAALVVVDAVARLVPGVVGDEASVVEESFSRGLLDFPQYTRPAQLAAGEAGGRGEGTEATLGVPPVLVSGDHAEIRRWRKRQALVRTLERRPDLLEAARLDEEERTILRELMAEREASRSDRLP